MEEFCLKLLNMSIQASFLIVIVVVLRLILRKSPKWIHCLMWLLVAVRLVCPFSIESTYSLAPNAEVISTSENEKRPNIQSGVVLIDRPANAYLESYYSKKNIVEQSEEGLNPVSVFSVIWLLGFGALTLYAVVSCFKIWKLVRESVEVQKHISICDRINIPFIFGILNPHIYLPSNLNEEQKMNVLAHEQAHLKRGDHFWKPFGYALLAVYWFNPLCWAAYILLCTDIEMACDEEVIKTMDTQQKKIYSKTLLSLSDSGSFISACPLAFGEVGVKQRIKSVLNYRKPAFWIVVIAVAVIIITSVLFLTNPKTSGGDNNGLAGNTELELNGESAAKDGFSEENLEFINIWANAFCNKDGKTIVELSTKQVQAVLEKEGLLDMQHQDVSFGWTSPWPMPDNSYWIVYQDDVKLSAEILYYTLTSEMCVTVWKEYITFEKTGDAYIVTEENFKVFENIENASDFDEAYPIINRTMMDYSKNGLAETLAAHAMLDNTHLYWNLQNPYEAAYILLNLNLDVVHMDFFEYEESALRIYGKNEYDYTDKKSVNIGIGLRGSEVDRTITMVKLDEYGGIWIPQDFGTAPEKIITEFDVQVPWILETVEDIFGEPGYLYNYQDRGYVEECHCFYNQQLEPILFVCGEYFFVDLDNDGINELINNLLFSADGAQSTMILKKINGKIQCGYADDLLDVEYDNYGFSSEYSYYLPEENKVEIFYWTDSKQKYESKKYAIDLNKIELYEYYSEFLYRDFVSELTKDENMEVDYIKDPYTGQFIVEGDMVYKYKKYLTGKNINETNGILYIVLTNDRDITWEQVNRSLISSNGADGLSGTLIIGIKAID